MQKTCCFFGTGKIPSTHTLYTKIYSLMKRLIEKEKVTLFIFGCTTLFDSVACVAAVKIKESYPHIQLDVYSQDTQSMLSKCTHIAVLNFNDIGEMLKMKKQKIKIYYLIS